MPKTTIIHCPYCETPQEIPTPANYAPRYLDCGECGQRFIMEPGASEINVYRDGEAPCCSDPDCRAIEMGSGDD